MRTSTGHAVVSGLLMVAICWPATKPKPTWAGEAVFAPVRPIERLVIKPSISPGVYLPPPDADAGPPPTARIDVSSFGKAPPRYPRRSIALKEEGRVVFSARCDADGWISEAMIRKSSGHERLEEAILVAARSHHWRCLPLKPGSGTLETRVELAYRFKLADVAKTKASPQRPARP
ncbi:MAG: TonB family protein [Azospirillaceae bacterium]|nr:TonB family protein [Azospirillaceae bacterium]